MKIFAAVILLALVSCGGQQAPESTGIEREPFDDFRKTVLSEDLTALADWLNPQVLDMFRRRLEFTLAFPLDGSWFTGTRERQPTADELAEMSDKEFFVKYMTGHIEVLGNPFSDGLRDAEVVAMTAGTVGFRHYIVTTDEKVGMPIVYSFRELDGKWSLVYPSIIDNYAWKLRAARGKTTEG